MLRYQIVKGVNLEVELCEVQPTTVSAAFADRGGLAHCHRFVESDGVVVTDLLRVGSVDVTLSGCRPTNASGSEIGDASAFRRFGSRDCRQVDRERDRKQEHAYHKHDSVTSAGYRVGLTASRRRTYTGDSSCCPPAVRLQNRTLTSADAWRAIWGRGHACSAARAGSCRARP